jgi:hypothetical protein
VGAIYANFGKSTASPILRAVWTQCNFPDIPVNVREAPGGCSGTTSTISAALNVVIPQTLAGLRSGRSAARRRLDGRSVEARHVKRLIASYSARLDTTDPTVLADIKRLAELEALCETYRSAALRREPNIDPAIVVRLEGLSRRLRRSLGLDTPPSEAPLSLEELGL